jgi:hypothetical protein
MRNIKFDKKNKKLFYLKILEFRKKFEKKIGIKNKILFLDKNQSKKFF